MRSDFLRMVIVLGLITAVGPFAIDMYLPALPTMGHHLHASAGAVQMTLTVFFIMVGICQLFYGPLSDIVGRKRPIFIGLTVFLVSSIGCALATNISELIACRALQAAGACAGMVVPRAIVRDLHTGPEATRLMSMLMLVVSLSPILAPMTGSAVTALVGWRGVFAVLTAAAGVALLLAATRLRETRPPAQRSRSSWRGAFHAYRYLLLDRTFIGLVLAGAFGGSSFFVFLGSASYVLIEHYRLSPLQFSLFFGLNAASFFGFSQLTGTLTRRFGLVPVARIAVGGFAGSLGLLALASALGDESLRLMLALLVVGYGFLGIVQPSTTVLALEEHGAIAGMASALMGAVRMIIGGAIIGCTGYLVPGSPRPMIAGIAACAMVAFVILHVTLRPGRALVSAPAD